MSDSISALLNHLREESIVALSSPHAQPRFTSHTALQTALSRLVDALRRAQVDGVADILAHLATLLATNLREFVAVARSGDAERVLAALAPLNDTIDRLEKQADLGAKFIRQTSSGAAAAVVAVPPLALGNVVVKVSSAWSCAHGQWSPNGSLVALAGARSVAMVERDSMEVVQVRELADSPVAIDAVRWSPDSRYLAAVISERARIELRSVDDPDWLAAVDCGLYGVADADWSPCGRCLVSAANDRLRTIVWSLGIDTSVPKVQFAESPAVDRRAHRFSPSGEFVAHLERRGAAAHDCVSLFECRTGKWRLAHHVCLDGLTVSVADALWSPDSRHLAVLDSSARCALHVIDARNGIPMGSFTDPVASLCVARWAPNSQCLAVLASDGQLRLLSTRDGTVTVRGKRELPNYKPSYVPHMAFSRDSRLLAVAYARTVLLIDLASPDSVHALEHSGNVCDLAWSTTALVLAVVDGGANVTLISTSGQAMPLRTSLRRIDSVQWSERTALLCDSKHKEAMLVSFER
jgi:WD40 repeat protein